MRESGPILDWFWTDFAETECRDVGGSTSLPGAALVCPEGSGRLALSGAVSYRQARAPIWRRFRSHNNAVHKAGQYVFLAESFKIKSGDEVACD